MRTALPLALVLACAPVEPAPAPAPAPAQAAAPATPLPRALVGVVEPWHRFDPALADASPVWLLTRYTPGTYPCREGPDGSLDMLVQDRFRVERVLRGAVAAGGVDLDLHALKGPGFPQGFAEGRRYLLFLRPGPDAQAWLADAKDLGGTARRLGADDVLAAIDLDGTPAEASAESTPATREGERDGFRWTPVVWEAARRARTLDAALQQQLAGFLSALVLRPGTPLAEVRSWLGAPDHLRLAPGPRHEQYVLARPAFDAAAQDGLYGDLSLYYGADLRLERAELQYLRWHVKPGQASSIALTPEDHARLGLPRWP